MHPSKYVSEIQFIKRPTWLHLTSSLPRLIWYASHRIESAVILCTSTPVIAWWPAAKIMLQCLGQISEMQHTCKWDRELRAGWSSCYASLPSWWCQLGLLQGSKLRHQFLNSGMGFHLLVCVWPCASLLAALNNSLTLLTLIISMWPVQLLLGHGERLIWPIWPLL